MFPSGLCSQRWEGLLLQPPGRTYSMLEEGVAGAVERSRTTHLCVQPRKELYHPWRQPQPVFPAATPLCAPQVSVGPGERKSPFPLWPEERGQEVAKQPLGCWTRWQNKTQNKSSAGSLSYPEASKYSESYQPKMDLAQVGASLMAAGGKAWPLPRTPGLRRRYCLLLQKPHQSCYYSEDESGWLERGLQPDVAEKVNSNCEVDQVQGPFACLVRSSLVAF